MRRGGIRPRREGAGRASGGGNTTSATNDHMGVACVRRCGTAAVPAEEFGG